MVNGEIQDEEVNEDGMGEIDDWTDDKAMDEVMSVGMDEVIDVVIAEEVMDEVTFEDGM